MQHTTGEHARSRAYATKSNGHALANALDLSGTGSAYIRVSSDEQDTERQYAAIRSFEQDHEVSIRKHNWFEDEGWARDQAEKRPEFQRMLKLAEEGKINWIVVSERDRFGTRDADQFIHFRYLLGEWGCRLYDVSGTDWTKKDVATVITAAVDGDKSEKEQHGISRRSLGGKVAKARLGEWQGGPLRLGLDVGCFDRATGAELWRVVTEGRDKRLKVYPDARTERFDGKNNFPKFQEQIDVLRITPSNDKAKIDAAVSVFKRYATEAIGFTVLAHYLSKLGYRNGCGGYFQGQQIEEMLRDPTYLGYYTWNKWHFGKFHRFAGGTTVEEMNRDEKGSRNEEADWVQSPRLFNPIVDRETWDDVQRKLRERTKRPYSPRSASQYLAGLVVCGNCGKRMVAGPIRKTKSKPRKDGHTGERYEYRCATYFKAVREKTRGECTCLRNSVFQDVLEGYIGKFLQETGRRLEMLTDGFDPSNLTGRLEEQETQAWEHFYDGIDRLISYLAEHHPADYAAIVEEDERRKANEKLDARLNKGAAPLPPGTLARKLGKKLDQAVQKAKDSPPPSLPASDFIRDCFACYRSNFDPAAVTAEIEQLEAEHDTLMNQWADLPTPRARDKAKERFAALEARIDELRQQQEDVSETILTTYRDMLDLQAAVSEAKQAMKSEAGEQALRQRAEALRAVIQRIECNFVATGETRGGWGKKTCRLVKVTIYPVVGDSREFPVHSEGSVQCPREWALRNSTALRQLLATAFLIN